jgi:hypothetical protein
MNRTVFLPVFLALSLPMYSQSIQPLPQPSFWYGSQFSGTSLSGTDSLGQPHLLPFLGNSSTVFSDNINGYPAVRIDSAGGYFSFSTSKLLDKENALFLIVAETQSSALEGLGEAGLWSLQNGSSRKHFLTSLNAGDAKVNVRYNYFPEAGTNVTTNLVHFSASSNSSVSESPLVGNLGSLDTLFIGKCDTVLFRGKLAEFLIIDKPFTAVERQIWQSYMALKYGVTMYRGNYLNSAGDTLWHYNSNLDYSAGVGGIGRDDTLFLAQNFSRIYGDSVKIALHNFIDNQQQTAQTPFQNNEYIFWGHNGAPVEIDNLYFYINNACYNLYQRKWKVKPVLQNNTKTIDFAFSSSPLGDLGGLRLFVGKDAGFNALETSIYTPNLIDNQKVSFSNIPIPQTPDNSFYFTLGKGATVLTSESVNGENGENSATTGAAAVFSNAHYLPNPVISDLRITYTLTRDANIWFSVHNNTGLSFCQTPPSNKPAGDGETIIPMSHLIQGTYTVYIHVDDMIMAHTVIKN